MKMALSTGPLQAVGVRPVCSYRSALLYVHILVFLWKYVKVFFLHLVLERASIFCASIVMFECNYLNHCWTHWRILQFINVVILICKGAQELTWIQMHHKNALFQWVWWACRCHGGCACSRRGFGRMVCVKCHPHGRQNPGSPAEQWTAAGWLMLLALKVVWNLM